MALTSTCIVRANGDIIWFDAILGFSKSYSAVVTKHPIERGGVVSDHTTLDNPGYTLAGVISDADFNRDRPDLTTMNIIGDLQQSLNEENGVNTVARVGVLNYDPVDDLVVVRYTQNPLTKYLPEAAARFLDQSAPSVSMSGGTKTNDATKMENFFTQMQREKEAFSVMEFKDGQLIRYANNCIFTGVSFRVDPNSGDAVYPDLKFESVTYVDSVLVKIPQRVTDKLKKKAEPTANKGSQTGTKTVEGDGKVPVQDSEAVKVYKAAKEKAKAQSTTGATNP